MESLPKLNQVFFSYAKSSVFLKMLGIGNTSYQMTNQVRIVNEDIS